MHGANGRVGVSADAAGADPAKDEREDRRRFSRGRSEAQRGRGSARRPFDSRQDAHQSERGSPGNRRMDAVPRAFSMPVAVRPGHGGRVPADDRRHAHRRRDGEMVSHAPAASACVVRLALHQLLGLLHGLPAAEPIEGDKKFPHSLCCRTGSGNAGTLDLGFAEIGPPWGAAGAGRPEPVHPRRVADAAEHRRPAASARSPQRSHPGGRPPKPGWYSGTSVRRTPHRRARRATTGQRSAAASTSARTPSAGSGFTGTRWAASTFQTLAVNDGQFLPDPDLRVEVMYRRAQPGWSPLQRTLHAYHHNVLGRAGREARRETRRSAPNRATRSTTAGVAVVPSPRGDSTDQTDGTTTPTGAGRTPVHAT